jgi:hypothetical protein
MRRWNRKRKVLRNLLLCALLGTAAYVLLGLPPYTTTQKLDRLERTYMLEDLEPVCTETVRHRRDDQWFGRWYTLVIARSPQGDYVTSSWEQGGLSVTNDMWPARIQRSGLCRVWGDQLYAAADGLRGAVSATMEVETKKQTFTLEGQQVADGVFSFSYLSPDHAYDRYAHNQDAPPSLELDLLDAVDLWYWEKVGPSSYTLDGGQEMLCTVTARDEAGETLPEMKLTVGVHELEVQNYYRW